MGIKTPKVHCFYPRSKNEADKLVLWIPKEEYPTFFPQRKKLSEMKKYYPDGIEIEVTDRGFAEYGISLELKPVKLKKAFRDLAKQKVIPESRIVDGGSFKKDAKSLLTKSRSRKSGAGVKRVVKKIRRLPEPKMTVGDNAFSVFSKIR
jgi:hypothetical protein